jgi:predicted short-subunit dehydrogenase-like oxidoreductase (DUF2520 family)
MQLKNIFIIGGGNVGTHLANALVEVVNVVGVYSINKQSAKELSSKLNVPFVSDISHIPACDLVLVCVNDNAVFDVVKNLSSTFQIAYTSGSVELISLPKLNKLGVFYPLQTFSKNKKLNLRDVPFLIESSDEMFEKELMELASLLSINVSVANSSDRKKLHLAAVFVNNFSNHLAFLAKEYLDENNLNWDYLKPLMIETVNKLAEVSPYEAQTGPARRNDTKVIESHLSELSGTTKEIYQVLSTSIINTYLKKNDKL